ncbi:caspase family protein [Neomegalonema sp.]|uniref:caspase family protein n=1 Tax=Neomegalonema sp. TaxID=2039713 RepID=UPI00262F03F6|nr:caspase family protein [Neomegalonema sp.]MDD2870011.1 caspase family protein [Neomegalonema sp.]
MSDRTKSGTKGRKRRWRGTAVLIAFWSLSAPSAVWAKSLALVIGNQNYLDGGWGPLRHAVSDAKGYDEALRAKGYEVTLKTDLTWEETTKATEAFIGAVKPGDHAVFVYSGHGWSDGETNYLVPTDLSFRITQEEARRLSLSLVGGSSGLLDRLREKGALIRVAIIDACRDSPFPPFQAPLASAFEPALAPDLEIAFADGGATSGRKGFSRDHAPQSGHFIIYSASEGQTSLDYLETDVSERYSLFTRVFLPYFRQDISLVAAFKSSQNEVADRARAVAHAQNPRYVDDIGGEFCLSGRCPQPAALLPSSPPPVDAEMQASCEAASMPTDADKPFGVQGISYDRLNPERHVAACEAMKRAAPREPLYVTNLARLRLKQGRGAEALALAREAAGLDSAAAMNLIGVIFETGDGGLTKDEDEATEWYEQAARAGNAAAMLNLSSRYAKGLGTEQDGVAAASWRALALQSGDRFVMNRIACAYYKGEDGLPQDDKEAAYWWGRAAELGQTDAIANLGWAYLHGKGVEADPERGIGLLRLAAASENAQAMNSLGLAFSTGKGVAQSDEEALRWWRKGAESKHVPSLENLGWAYWSGRGVERDEGRAVALWTEVLTLEKSASASRRLGWASWSGRGAPQDDAEAVRLWKEAKDGGDADAFYALGLAHWTGRGAPQDDAEAVRLWRQAAQKEDADGLALYMLGLAHWSGRGAPQDDAEAVRLWRQAAQKENTDALYMLGLAHEEGRGGLELDQEEAVASWLRAADLGDPEAMYGLSSVYSPGSAWTLPKDPALARRWLIEAANKDHRSAMRRVGDLYLSGSGVPQDHEEALRWWRKAAEAGDSLARRNLIDFHEGREPFDLGQAANPEEALRWRVKAAEAGDQRILLELVGFYMEPVGGRMRNEAEALRWMRKGAEAGDLPSMLFLSLVLSGGVGLETPFMFEDKPFPFPAPDLNEARFWLRKALEHPKAVDATGRAEIQRRLDRLDAQIP